MTYALRISFFDLATPHRELQPELIPVVENAFEVEGFTGGPRADESHA